MNKRAMPIDLQPSGFSPLSPAVSRRSFLAGATAALASPALVRGATKPLLTVGLAADAQYADIAPAGTRHYREAVGRLAEAVDHFNSQPLDFCIHLGDLIDRDWHSFDEILEPLEHSRHPFHQLLGNHDFEVRDELKPRVPERLGMAKRYSALDRNRFRFVILDTTEVSTYAHPSGSSSHAAARAELDRLRAARLRQAQPWNSGMSPAQLDWFDAACREAAAKDLHVVVFAHHPVFPDNAHNLWNSEQVLQLLDRHPNVIAWFNGHNHAGNFGLRKKVAFVTLRGMVETPDTNAFAVARFHADRIELIGHGREPSRMIEFAA